MSAELGARRELEGELGEYAAQIEWQKVEVASLLEGVSEEQFNWRPAEGSWSVGEHLSHLSKVIRPYLTAIDGAVALARAKEVLGEGPYRHGWLGNRFVRSMEPPVKLKVKAPKLVLPASGEPLQLVLDEFQAAQDDVLASMRGAIGVDLGRARIRSPYLKLLKLSVGQAYGAIVVHNRRHIWHMRRVLGEVERSG